MEEYPEYGSEFHDKADDKYKKYCFLSSCKCDTEREVINPGGRFAQIQYYRSGRDALRAVALSLKTKYRYLLIPALCCESMIKPFTDNSFQIRFFKLKADFTADFYDIVAKFQSNTVLLYMNYFGIQSLKDENLEMLKAAYPETVFLRDRTHDFLIQFPEHFIPDYSVCSMRKWLAVPDGGVLLSKVPSISKVDAKDKYYTRLRSEAMKNKSRYLKKLNSDRKEKYRRQFELAKEYLDKETETVGISAASLNKIRSTDWRKIAEARCNNARVLSEYLHQTENITGIKYLCPDHPCLYYPVLSGNRNNLQQALAAKDIYCPVIWPLPELADTVCSFSAFVSDHMLALPCDQRYSKEDMKKIAEKVNELAET